MIGTTTSTSRISHRRPLASSDEEFARAIHKKGSKVVGETDHSEDMRGADAKDDEDNRREDDMECEPSEEGKASSRVDAADVVGYHQYPTPSEEHAMEGVTQEGKDWLQEEEAASPAGPEALGERQSSAMDEDSGDEEVSADRIQRGPLKKDTDHPSSLAESVRGEYDRMDMMAAVAMTELLSGRGRDSRNSASEKAVRPPAEVQLRALATPPCHRRAESNHSASDPKRRHEYYPHGGGADVEGSYMSKRRKSASMGDDEVRAVVLSASNMSVESRNPSPIDKVPAHQHQLPRTFSYPSPHHESPPSLYYNVTPGPPMKQHQTQKRPPHSSRRFSSNDSSFHLNRFRSSPPPPPVGYSPLSLPMASPLEHHRSHAPHRHHGYHYPPLSPLEYFGGRAAGLHLTSPPRPSPYERSPPPICSTHLTNISASSSYCEDLLRVSSGLPKPLSYRKICSKCGKTRSEHAESTGFGNKCNFRDCGKCGASLDLHVAAGCPMGVHCILAVEQGARPGSADAYRRKLRELAARADLQRELRDADRRSPMSLPSAAPIPSSANQQQTPAAIADRDP
jgi:hypothetical protein